MVYVFWGYVFLVLAFAIDLPWATAQAPAYFDLFPDFLGYGAIAVGFVQLDKMSGKKSYSHVFVWTVAALSFVWWILNALGKYTVVTPFSILAGLIYVTLQLLVAWMIVRKIADLEEASGRDFASRQLILAWVIEAVGVTSAAVLRWVIPQLSSILNFVGILAGLFYLLMLWKAKDLIHIYYDGPRLYDE